MLGLCLLLLLLCRSIGQTKAPQRFVCVCVYVCVCVCMCVYVCVWRALTAHHTQSPSTANKASRERERVAIEARRKAIEAKRKELKAKASDCVYMCVCEREKHSQN